MDRGKELLRQLRQREIGFLRFIDEVNTLPSVEIEALLDRLDPGPRAPAGWLSSFCSRERR